MDLKMTYSGLPNVRSLQEKGIPFSEFCFSQTSFRLAEGSDDGQNPPIRRDDAWQDMLRMVLGYVPEGAEHAPPCYCELFPIAERYDFAGLAGLPSEVRLMDGFFPVRDQSKRGACFAFALVALCEYMLGKTVELSEQSLFHFTKLVTPGKVEDLGDGAIILDSIHAVEEYGICPLSEWHYNPESWNYVEDPYNEGQGKALQRKLEAAQPYRFRNWRTLSRGSVLQFKQTLSAGFPIYTGVVVTNDWDGSEVRQNGVIPYPKLFWRIRVLPPPLGLVEEIMQENGIDPNSEEAEAAAMQIAGKLMHDTIEYVGSAVFKCGISVCEAEERNDGVELVLMLDKIRGGHALCLAGYVDDDSYPGGGYFIARNSWSDDKWAPDSPEMPGYALLPYAYIADLGLEGNVMSDFPRRQQTDAASQRSVGAAVASPVSVAIHRASTPSSSISDDSEFTAWLAAHALILDKPQRDQSGVVLRPGTPVLMVDQSNPGGIIRDTPQNRAKLHEVYAAGLAAGGKKELQKAVREIADEAFSRQTWILSVEDICGALAERGWDSATPKTVRSALLALQAEDTNTYALCINQFGREEFRHASVVGGRKRVT